MHIKFVIQDLSASRYLINVNSLLPFKDLFTQEKFEFNENQCPKIKKEIHFQY